MADRSAFSIHGRITEANDQDIEAIRQTLREVFEAFYLTHVGTIQPIVREDAGEP